MKNILFVLVLGSLLSACANSGSADKDAQITQDWTVEKLYAEAQDESNSGNYTRSLKLYEILESRFPQGRFAQQAQLDKAYVYFKDEQPEKAHAELDRFQRLNPRHHANDYALYLRGLILFNEDQSFVNKLASQDWAERDPRANRRAYQAFYQLITQYPNSRYVADAKERLVKLVDALAGHEIAVARYYAQRGAYLAAANRAQNIVKGFQNTRFVEEALALMEFSYRKMQRNDLAEDTKRVLASSFPNSPYLNHEWKNKHTAWWRY